ncbi:hypothetical protein [Aureimonas phyllosphaerae]|uniref:Uncharacterized protein n=1 Tax=Aureimonas phyllosphaerae TaxID=1166078 RepID=A0A7W6BZN5_9HYPH|nr:hypothetical protein [Aureimonas phyllosphaerae]MBB3936671.1 hypothetical protein [Aureimonas phyllosphaerae]
MLRRIALIVMIAFGCILAAGAGVVIWSGFILNEWIDRCADETSSRYIVDPAERDAACRTLD